MATAVTYFDLLEKARSKLSEGESRFADEPTHFLLTWWPDEPGLREELLSSYGVDSSFSDLHSEFFDEVAAIRDSLKEVGHKVKLADWQRGGTDSSRRLFEGLNRHAEALGLWDKLCVPVRCRGTLVVRIWSPLDAMGTPIIQALPVEEYVRRVAIQTARASAEVVALKRSRYRWRVMAFVLGFILFACLATWFSAS